MRDLLAAQGRAALAQLARANVLLGFDYDGTLAPIVRDPARASLPRSTRARLSDVIGRYPCAVVSGRSRADVLRRLEGLPLLHVVGNHGMEWDQPPTRVSRRAVIRWREELRRACEGLEGVSIEDKTWSLAVHVRGAKRKAEALRLVLGVAGTLPGARIVHGKDVVNLVHADAANKGSAILELRRRLGCDRVLYVGDDVTDEDAFALPGVLSVRVGRSSRSHARWYLRAQQQIDALLDLLVALRGRGEQPILNVPRMS